MPDLVVSFAVSVRLPVEGDFLERWEVMGREEREATGRRLAESFVSGFGLWGGKPLDRFMRPDVHDPASRFPDVHFIGVAMALDGGSAEP